MPDFAVVCAIAKDEDPYLEEWAAYHLAIGFDHIYLYDNNSKLPVRGVLQDAFFKGRVTVYTQSTRPGFSAQTDAYRHFLDHHRADSEWAAVIDIDEFVNLKADFTIGDFLRRFPDVSGVALNWRIFGSAGRQRYEPAPLAQRFQRASISTFQPNNLRKGIHRLRDVQSIDIHRARYLSEGLVASADGTIVDNEDRLVATEENYRFAQINHYFVKSYEEWLRKVRRGYTDKTVRPVEMFSNYDRNEVFDDSLMRFCGITQPQQALAMIDYGNSQLGADMPRLSLIFRPGDGRLASVAGTLLNGVFAIRSAGGNEVGLYGPYIDLPAGDYAARVHFKGRASGKAFIDVGAGSGQRIDGYSFDAQQLGRNGFVQIDWRFTEAHANVEVRLFCEDAFIANIASVEIIPVRSDLR